MFMMMKKKKKKKEHTAQQKEGNQETKLREDINSEREEQLVLEPYKSYLTVSSWHDFLVLKLDTFD